MSAAVQGLQQQPYQLQVPKHSMQVQGEDVPCFKEYVHVSDLAAGYVATISRASNPPAIYNVGSGRPVTHQEVMNACETVLGVSAQVRTISGWLQHRLTVLVYKAPVGCICHRCRDRCVVAHCLFTQIA